MENNKQKKYVIFQPLLLALMVAFGMVIGYQLDSSDNNILLRVLPGENNVKTGKVEEVLRFMESKYLFDPDDEQFAEEAINGIFSKLDPYSLYITGDHLETVNDNMNGNYKGIGIETMFVGDTIFVSKVLEKSPAEKAGLKKMDRIIAVDSISYAGDQLDFAKFRKHFRSGKQEESVLKVIRKNSGEELLLNIIPDKVETSSIRYYSMLDDSTLYVKIDQFISKTYREFMEVLEDNQIDSRMPNLLIDLRDNPGGYLTEVTKILSQFFDDSEKLLVSTKVRNGKTKEYKTTGRTFYTIDNIIVLVNEHSASGSEVLAGALQDWDRALIIGKKSYGKGLVQEQYNLGEGGAVRLTVANYYLPTGRSIQHQFHMDSLFFDGDQGYSRGDSTYYTLLKRREMPDSEGIVPDLEIDGSEFEQHILSRFFNDANLDQKLIAFIEENELYNYSNSEELFENLELEKAFMDSLLKNALIPETLKVEFEQLTKSRIAYFLFDEKDAYKYLLEKDPVVISSMEAFEKEDMLERLFTSKK